MPNKKSTTVNHFRPLRWVAAAGGVLTAITADALLGLGSATFIIAILTAIGAFLLVSPNVEASEELEAGPASRETRQVEAVKKPESSTSKPEQAEGEEPARRSQISELPHFRNQGITAKTSGQDQPARKQAPIKPLPKPKKLTEDELATASIPDALNDTWFHVLSEVHNPDIVSQAQSIIDDATWVHENYDALVNHPEHKATVTGIARSYLPETLRLYLTMQDDAPLEGSRETIDSLSVLDHELTRIKQAIIRGRLKVLESHRDALHRQFKDE